MKVAKPLKAAAVGVREAPGCASGQLLCFALALAVSNHVQTVGICKWSPSLLQAAAAAAVACSLLYFELGSAFQRWIPAAADQRLGLADKTT